MVRKGISRTDIGKVRAKNQDAIFVRDEPFGGLDNLYIVADGMGGHKAGEIASKMAIEAFCEYIEKNHALVKEENLENHLKMGVVFANSQVFSAQRLNPDWKGMGTTFSACAFKNNKLFYAHVGDSRIYSFAKKEITPVSHDHTFVAEMLRFGKITETEAQIHPHKNILTRALGTESTILTDAGSFPVSEDMKILICSDGLSNMVSDKEILEIMNRDTDDGAKADALLALALENGGKDNISLIIV